MENTNNTYEELVQLKESGEIGWVRGERPRHERGNCRGVYDPHRGTRTGIGATPKLKTTK